jgi:membrane-associated protease RseP (regulator of RpoE activity)
VEVAIRSIVPAPSIGVTFQGAMSEAAVQARPRLRIPLLNVALFLATIATTLQAGASLFPSAAAGTPWQAVASGIPYTVALLSILLCHEMGHYLAARAYGVDSTLPFFIPIPYVGIGTLGAVIRIRSAMPSRRAVLDIGAAGPIAGFVVAVPLLLWGMAHSQVIFVGAGQASHTDSLLDLIQALWQALNEWLHGTASSASGPVGLSLGDSLLTWGAARLMKGPLTAGYDIVLHPVATAAWFGLFVTTLNLIPIGQLDGGHVTYALFGQRWAQRLSRVVAVALLLLGLFLSVNWFFWWLLTRFLVGSRHPPALDEGPLSPGRRVLAIAALVMLAITFVPVPLRF